MKKNISVVVATHKETELPVGQYYLPVHAGKEGKKDLGYQGDNTGINISLKNSYYSELTAMYWAWKNLESDYVGLVHYRRYFTNKSVFLRNSKDKFQYILSDSEIEKLVEEHDVVLPQKRKYYIETLYSHYKHTHYIEPLDKTREILKDNYPDYINSFDKVMKETSGHMFNMFIMKKEILDDYCNWLFPILEELDNQVDVNQYDSFHARFPGRVSELLLNVWIDKNNVKYREVRVVSTGKVEWGRKIISFVRAKFTGNRYGKSF